MKKLFLAYLCTQFVLFILYAMRKIILLVACCLGLYAVECNAQTKTRVIVTDEFDGVVHNKIDYIVVPPETTDEVLKRFGYDDASISKAQSDRNRRISISIEELADVPSPSNAQPSSMFGEKTTVIEGSNATVSSSKKTRVIDAPKSGEIKLEDLVSIPKGAKVEDMPDGSKRITTYKNDGHGNRVVDKTITVRRKSAENAGVSEQETEWTEIENSSAPTLSKSTVVIPANAPRNTYTEMYDGTNLDMPNITVKTDDLDGFDNSTLAQKDPSLLNAPALKIDKYQFSPDFKEGFFRLSFSCEADKEVKISMFDVIGAPVYTETISNFIGSYSKLIADFSVYRKGTFLLLITQNGAKFSRKIEIE